ncbi:MAG: DUF3168 domain-containing protein [Xanthomonadaceae bacterium]|nr:DUF3168 domain-containing protein [Xanthomonadaceae bacterium]
MNAPIHAVVASSAAVRALLQPAAGPLRFYLFGMAPEKAVTPYAVWQTVGGEPENYLGDLPDVDNFTLQIDAYADDQDTVPLVAKALRDAIEPRAHIVQWLGESKAQVGGRWRLAFRVDWITPR